LDEKHNKLAIDYQILKQEFDDKINDMLIQKQSIENKKIKN